MIVGTGCSLSTCQST